MSEFERLPATAASGTSKLFSRQDLWEAPDPERAYSERDFFERLAKLFGKEDPIGGFVVRHVPSGVVITCFVDSQGEPSYGGIARHRPSHSDEMQALRDEWEASGLALSTTMGTGEMPSLELLEARKRAWRRLAELSAPEGYPAAVERLEALLQETDI